MIGTDQITRQEFLEEVYDCFTSYEGSFYTPSFKERMKVDFNSLCHKWYVNRLEECFIEYGEYARSDIYWCSRSANHTFRRYIPDTVLGKMVYSEHECNYNVTFRVLDDFVIRSRPFILDNPLNRI